MPVPHTVSGALAALLVTIVAASPASADPARDTILQDYAAQAGVSEFSAADGEALFQASHSGGKAETPSCTTCHGADPKTAGKTRAGKPIDPMAVSANPARFTDVEKVEKWFRRNCNSVLGRECSAREKGDVITYLSNL